jgi:hypothetical protein
LNPISYIKFKEFNEGYYFKAFIYEFCDASLIKPEALLSLIEKFEFYLFKELSNLKLKSLLFSLEELLISLYVSFLVVIALENLLRLIPVSSRVHD